MAVDKSPRTSDVSLLPHPANIIPNFEHPKSKACLVYYSATVCIPIILSFSGLRCYGKFYILKKTWDDLICLIGVVLGLTYIALGIALVRSRNAFGIHQWELTSFDTTSRLLRLSLVQNAVYGPLIWLIKLSVFFLYIEIFGRLRWIKIGAYLGATLSGLYYFGWFITFLVWCTPRETRSPKDYVHAWGSSRCTWMGPLLFITGAVNIVSDVYMMFLPLPAIWKLQLPKKKKIGISIVFLTGAM